MIARAELLEELNELLAEEPYRKAKVMRFSKITEFNPVQHQPILNDWFEKRSRNLLLVKIAGIQLSE